MLMGTQAVLRTATFSESTLWREVKRGSFPQPIRISARRVAWRSSDVEEWIERKASLSVKGV